jgi:WD40 repeat protein
MDIHGLKFTPDGRRLVVFADHQLRLANVYDANSGTLLFESPALAWSEAQWTMSHDGRWLAYGCVATKIRMRIELVDLTAPMLAVTRSIEIDTAYGTDIASVHALAFSPDGRTLAMSREWAGIELYDVASGRRSSELRGHEIFVGTLAFLPDGSRLISGSWDHTVKVWDPASGRQLLSLPLGPTLGDRVERVLVTPDGTRVIGLNGVREAGMGGNAVVVWSAPRPAR